ncbi:MAG: tyrosine-protein kinase family protein [Hyphomonadaceae bacterium]
MTTPATGDRLRHQPGTLGAASLRRQPSKSLALARLRRGVRRQWLLFVLLTVVVSIAGIAIDLTGGSPILSSAAFWLPLAGAVALAATLAREISRNTITSLSSFGKHRGYAILGAAPELTPRTLRQLPPDKRNPLGCLALLPASPFATAFRDLQATVSKDAVVAFTSSVPNEGSTTAALCTAISASQQGQSVVVIDCDLRRRSLTRALGFDPDEGLLDACADPEAWHNFVGEEDETGVHFIPAARGAGAWRHLGSMPGFKTLLTRLRRHYDLIVLDCPPALASAEGAVIAGLAEKTVLVAGWDRTPLNAVRRTMGMLQRRPGAKTGVYVNRVPPEYRFGRLRGG